MADPIGLFALISEAAIGYPSAVYKRIGHPVGAFARFISACEIRWNKKAFNASTRRLLGVLTIILVAGSAAVGGWFLTYAAMKLLPAPFSWLVLALLAIPGLAQKSLYQHVRAVYHPLHSGNIASARHAVGMIVGRDTRCLDEAGVSRAAIESLSESFCDGVVAPAFWLVVAGLPGLYAYKAINTADSLIGHKEAQFRDFGWAAARLDDLVNLIPARLAGLLLCLSALGGWRVMWRDCRRHASPNAGWPEAAMAGALGVSLAGPVTYDGVTADKEWIGAGPAPQPADIMQALRYYRIACVLLWLIAGGIAWAA